MKSMRTITGLSFFLCVGGATAQTQANSELHIRADTPVINIEKREDGRNFMRLPSLTYELDIDKKCGGDLRPAVLSLSVADTRRSFNADDFSDSENFAIRFAVPAAQIGPIAVESFCVQSETAEGETESKIDESEPMTVPAVLSLQASLLCASEMESQITYASASLDITLACTKPETDDSDALSTSH